MSNKQYQQWLDEFTISNPNNLGYIISWMGKDYWLVSHGDGLVSDFNHRMSIAEFFKVNKLSSWSSIRTAKPGDQKLATNNKG